MKAWKSIATAAIAVVAFYSCSDNRVFDTYKNTNLSGWEKNDTISFSIPALKESGAYDSELGLRINESYPFMGLTLIVEQRIFPADTTVSDTLKCRLIDNLGNTNGQGVSYYQYRFHIRTMELKQGDSLQVSIRHNMKREILPGVSDIGMSLSLR